MGCFIGLLDALADVASYVQTRSSSTVSLYQAEKKTTLIFSIVSTHVMSLKQNIGNIKPQKEALSDNTLGQCL
jgi:PIN domain nuclease of toxin-antitoxin system